MMDRSANMRAIRSKGTKPEMIVRRAVHHMGYRYRLHRTDLPGNPDLVFPSRKKVIFVHGCFWHSHSCQLAHRPRSNLDYWEPKLARTKHRDALHLMTLKELGWQCLILWECELKNMTHVQHQIYKFLELPPPTPA